MRDCMFLLLTFGVFCDAGLLKRRRQKSDDPVETLLAVGIIAKALAETDSPSEVSCPPPIQVTRIVSVPVHQDRIVFVKDKSCKGKYHRNNEMWATSDSADIHNWNTIINSKVLK